MDFLSRFFRQKKKETTLKKARSSSRRIEREGQLADDFKTFILEPILTPSALIDGGEDVPDATVLDGNDLPWLDTLDAIALEDVVSSEPFTSGTFEVGATGEVAIDFLYDGGSYEGELAIFSLEGMEEYEPGSPEFIQEAANRALSDTEWGHIVISDQEEGARFVGNLGEGNFNQGEHQGTKTFQMRAGDKFGIMLVPNGEVEQIFENPNIGGSKTPLFSLSTANPNDNLHLGQIADITGDGQTFVFEDVRFDSNWYDKDYNDIIFQVRGAKGEAPDIDEVIADGKNWRDSDLGQEILEFADIESDFVPFSETEIEDIEIEDIEVANTQGSTEIAESEPIVVETIEISEVAVEEIATSPELIWKPAIATLEQQIEILQQQPEFSQQMQLTFGEDWTAEKLDVLLAELRTGEARPYIEIVSHAELGASGAYGVETNTIYLSQEFLTENWDKPELLQRVFVEEIGHYLDAQFNGEDSPGDEGEIFATWVLGGALSESQYAALKREDDRATRTLNGQTLNLELNGSPATGLTAQYFRNQNLTDLVLTRVDPNIDFDWGTNAPDPSYGNQSDVWSARWQGQIDVPHTDTYTFSSIADDGMRLWIDGELVIDNWDDGNGSSYTRSQDGAIALEAGQHDIKVEYRDQWWVAKAQLLWNSPLLGGQAVIPPEVFSPYEPPEPHPAGNGTGLRGEYFKDMDLSDRLLVRTDATLDFDWGTNAPDPSYGNQSDVWSARWTGEIEARYDEEYTFSAMADDGMRVWVDGELLIDFWDDGNGSSVTRNGSGKITLEAGEKYDIKVEYRDQWWVAKAQLLWESDSQLSEVIPTSQLYPAEPPPFAVESGDFLVGASGEVSFDYLFDGGAYEGEIAIFSLAGMEEYEAGTLDFVREAARRALSDSPEGHTIIEDGTEGAKYTGYLPEGNHNRGTYPGVKTVTMNPGDRFGVMLIPGGTVQGVYDDPNQEGAGKPIFSLATANPDDGLTGEGFVDVTGNGCGFAFEDVSLDSPWSDKDFNDVIFKVEGARGRAKSLDEAIDPAADWRESEVGQQILAELDCPRGIELIEQERFNTIWEQVVTIPEADSLLSFDLLDLIFDRADTEGINDAFEVSLTDSEGNSLLHTIAAGGDGFFNITEGLEADLAAGVTFDGQKVTVDLSQIPAGTEATLQLRLVNNDTDTTTTARIDNIEIVPRGEGEAPAAIPQVPLLPEDREIDFSALDDVSESMEMEYGQTRWSDRGDVLDADLFLRNEGTYATNAPLLVAVKNIDNPEVAVLGIDGLTPEGLPYYDFSHLVEEGKLDPEEITGSRTLKFHNPTGEQFSYELVVLSALNRAPEFVSEPDIEIVAGQSYVYDADATDLDGDELVYELLVAPEGMTIDENGLIHWQTSSEDVGTQAVMVRVSDERGGEDFQAFNVNVVEDIPNRPPIITSTPEVDGNINAPYTYNTVAKDPDGDSPLIYSLETFPQGMAIDSQGVISWTPDGEQLGIHEVMVKVEDGRGGETEQVYTIRVEPEPGNNPPVIISSPFTQFEIPGVANPADGDVTPVAIDLDLELGEIVQQEVSLTLPTESLFPAVDVFLLFDDTGSFSGYAPTLISEFPDLVEELQNQQPSIDWGFGVGRFEDYYNSDKAFVLNQPIITSDLEGFNDSIEAALNRAAPGNGGDGPETLIEGLYQTATGAGFDGNNDGDTTDSGAAGSLSAQTQSSASGDIPAFDSFLADPDNNILAPAGTLGGAGFRQGALPIILAATDIGTVWQPDGLDTITGVGGVSLPLTDLTQYSRPSTPGGRGASIQPTIDALNELGALVIGLGTGTSATSDPRLVLESLATLTGATNDSSDSIDSGIASDPIDPGDPLYFTVHTANLADRVSSAIQAAVTAVDIDVDLVASYADGTFENLTGLVSGVNGGDTVDFTAQFVGDGTAKSFDLLFLRPGSNTLLGSIPVTINNDYIYPAYAIDPDGDPVTYSLESSPEGATINPDTGKIAWEPTEAGEYEFIVAAKDDRGGYTTQSYTLNITQGAINTPPQITTTEFPSSGQIGQEFSYQVSAEDEDGDRLAYYLVDPPTGMIIDRDTGEIAWIPEEAEDENVSVSVKVLDGRGGEDHRTFEVEIVPPTPNRDPQILSEPPTDSAQLAMGETYRYDAVATDEDADPIEYTLVVKPEGMSVDAETGTIVWNPTNEQGGTHNIILRASDGRGGVDLQVFQVEVEQPNRAPLFTSNLDPEATPQVGKPFTYQATALDPDGDTLTYEVISGNAEIDEDTGLLQWTPTEEGETEIVIEVSDGQEQTTQTLTLEVAPPQANTPPEITSTPSTAIRLGNTYFYDVRARDIDGDNLTYSLSENDMAIDSEGRIVWTPKAEDFGVKLVKVQVSDGTEITEQEWEIVVSDRTPNNAPQITSIPDIVTDTDRVYQYHLRGSDADGDKLLWGLESAPAGMAIDPETGVLVWQPEAEDIGEHTIAVRVTDGSIYAIQEYTLTVRGANSPPQIVSTPITQGTVGEDYTYQVTATDIDGDKLTYIPVNVPDGMTVDKETGVINWTPETVGTDEVEILVDDGREGTQTQKFKIEVGTQSLNRPPEITSTPIYTADTQGTYTYEIEADDPDGDDLTYRDISLPAGMSLNGNILTWENPTIGEHQVVIGVEDSQTGAAQGFTLTVYDNQAPNILENAPLSATPETPYRYDIKATDPEGGTLTYQLLDSPANMEIDPETGRIEWTPELSDAGQSYSITVEVEDEAGAKDQYTYTITVSNDTEAPKVKIKPLGTVYTVVNNGETEYQIEKTEQEEISFQALATDNEEVKSLQVFINDIPVIADGNGVVTATVGEVGSTIAVKAIATDKAGNQSETTFEVEIVDTLTPTELEVKLNLENIPDGEIENPVEITGTVKNLNGGEVEYELEAIPVAGGEAITVFTGTGPIENGALGTFNPTLLPNDSYTLRLTAKANGRTTSIEEQVDVIGELKLGNFQLSFTDLEVPVAGIPITVTRTYDSLYASQQDNFGYGWRLEFRDTNLQTSLGPDEGMETLGRPTKGFRDGDKVYITLPGGKREAFTFQPTPDRLSGYLTGPNGEGGLFHPTFVSQDGSELTLTVDDARLTRSPDGQYVGLNSLLYNPIHSAFGGKYTLTTKEGIEYEIDANSGDLLQVKDLNENTLTYSDAGIVSSTGKEVKFERDAEGRIKTVIDPAGEKIVYNYDENGDLISVIDREGNETELFYEETERPHYLTRIEDPLGRNGIRTEYDPVTGRLTKMLDVNGKAIELSYDPANSLQTVKDLYGEETRYIYDNNGNVLTEIQPSGLRIDRTYENNRVKTETLITTESGLEGWTTTYKYDNQGNLLNETDPNGEITRYTYGNYGRLLTETDPLGNTTTYTYSPRGNLRSSKDAEGNVTQYDYDLRGNLLSLTDANQKITRFTYDNFGNVKTVTDAEGNVTEYDYDLNGNRTQETRKNVTQPDGTKADIISYWNYDQEGRVQFYTDPERIDPNNIENPDNASTLYTYDLNGNQIQITDAKGNISESIYDEKGQLVVSISADETTENTDNPRTVTVYDQGGRERAFIDAQGNITHYLYDIAGRLEETITGDTTTVETFLSEMTFLGTYQPTEYELSQVDWTKVIYPIETPNRVTNLTAPRNKTEYSEDGRVKAEIDEKGNRTEYKYDDLGRLEQVIYPDTTDNNIDDRSITTYQYDKAGQRTHEIDAKGNITEYKYDKLGRVTKVIFADETFSETQYDKLGRRVESKDPEGIVTQYEYDDLGRLKAVVQPLNGGEIRTEYFYDEAGRLIEVKDAEQNSTYYKYDKAGRRVIVELPEGQSSLTTYDEVGNIKTYTDFNGEVTNYDYDPQNRLELKDLEDDEDVIYTYTDDGQIETITDSRGTTEFKYDTLGRLLWRKDPDGEHLANGNTIEYQYDDAGNITQVETKAGIIEYKYDEWNRLEEVIEGGETTIYLYDEVGNLKETQFPNGTVETRVYDELHRLQTLAVKDENEELLAKYEYELNDAGYREQVKETLLQPDGTIVERTIDYDYDELYRLLEAAILGGETVEYAYDDVGNRISSTDAEGTREYVYDDNDRLMQELVNGVVVVSYIYDDNGNLKSRTEGNETVNYVWDDQNRLVEVQGSSGIVNYVYDDNNIRVSQTIGTETTSYLLDKNRPYAQVLAEYVGDDEIASYVYGLDLISQERGNVDSYYLVDGLGSTRGLVDENGNVTDVYHYDAYGNLTDSVGSSENDYLFAGEQFDGNLDQYYLRQRYYDPSVGRFTRRDTYEGNNFNPITLHKYLYANGNPVNGIDPNGLYAIQQELTAAKVVGDILAVLTFAYIQVSQDPPERLGGFGEGAQPTLDLYPHPRDPRDSLIARLLSYPRGFGAGQQPNLPTHTGHPRDNTLDDLIRYIFYSSENPPFRDFEGDIYYGEYSTSQGVLTLTGEVIIEGEQLHLANIGVFPRDQRNTVVGVKRIREIQREVMSEAKNQGFKELRITGRRSSGASFNPNNIFSSGKHIDRTFPLD